MNDSTRPSALDYDDWRSFLRDRIDWMKVNDSSFSTRKFSRDAGLKSHTHLGKVLEGKIDLNAGNAASYARAMGLSRVEFIYFIGLVTGMKINIIIYGDDRNNYLDLMVLACLRDADADMDPERVSRITRGIVTSTEAREIMTYFKTQGLIDIGPDGPYLTERSRNTHWIPEIENDLSQAKDMFALLQRVMPTEVLKAHGASFYFKARPEDVSPVLMKIHALIRDQLTQISEAADGDPLARLYGLYTVNSYFGTADGD